MTHLIKTIQSHNEALQDLQGLRLEKTWFLTDVDDTLIACDDPVFRYDEGRNPFYKAMHDIIEGLKKGINPGSNPTLHYETAVRNFREARRVTLTEETWPQTLKDLAQKGSKVFALTKMNPYETCKDLPLYEWRRQELRELGLVFTDYLKEDVTESWAYTKGILMTGDLKKSETLQKFSERADLRPERLVFVDDLETQVRDVGSLAEAWGIPYQGYIYEGARHMKGAPNFDIVRAQLDTFCAEGVWVPAEKMRKSNQKKTSLD